MHLMQISEFPEANIDVAPGPILIDFSGKEIDLTTRDKTPWFGHAFLPSAHVGQSVPIVTKHQANQQKRL